VKEFTEKLQLIYRKLFDEDIEKFTEAFIDYEKFKKDKNSKNEFFTNRKIVLRRWLRQGSYCTSDFQKSFKNYKISLYKIDNEPLFRLKDFRNSNLAYFEKRLDIYIKQQQRVHINTDYRYIYLFNRLKESIESYSIIDWSKSEEREDEIAILLEYNNHRYRGTFAFQSDNNIFLTMRVEEITHYLLFHDNNDKQANYIVGMAMGYLPIDNKVPHAQKAILAKSILNSSDIELLFILNETESISAIENRINSNIEEIKIDPFVKYHNQFKKYHKLFSRLLSKQFKQNFYYRLAFREFYAIKRLFEKVSKRDSYFVFNYHRAFFEMIKTLEEIKNTQFYIVMEFNETNLFLDSNYKIQEIKRRFFNLYNYGVETTIIFVVDNIAPNLQNLLREMNRYNIKTKVVERIDIIYEVNSLNFAFINIGDKRDFVLADPLRDNKDVYKLFTDEITMDEYRVDYAKILSKSRLVSK
jgi:hypothetical protein